MAKSKFEGYGGTVEHFEHTEKKFDGFNDVQGGGSHVDPYGDEEKKEKDSMNMNAAEAFNKKDYTKIEAMGTDYPKKSGKPGQFSDNKGDHFKVDVANEDIDAFGTDAAKSTSYQSRH